MNLPHAAPTALLHQVAARLLISLVPVTATRWPLLPEEEELVVNATERRRAQFAAGRWAARHAMTSMLEVGGPSVAIGRGDEGEPLFPPEFRGSISHTGEYAVALVGRADGYESVGIDIDDGRLLGDEAAAQVTWNAEVARIRNALAPETVARSQNFAFSAKEAVFKCQYPLTQNAALKHKHARLLSGPGEPGMLGVSGWRVHAMTAKVLERIVVRRHVLGGQTLALALIKRETGGSKKMFENRT